MYVNRWQSLERRLKQLDAEKALGAVQTMIQQDDEETDKKNEEAQKRPCDGTRSHGEVPAEIAADIGPAVPLKSHTSEALM